MIILEDSYHLSLPKLDAVIANLGEAHRVRPLVNSFGSSCALLVTGATTAMRKDKSGLASNKVGLNCERV